MIAPRLLFTEVLLCAVVTVGVVSALAQGPNPVDSAKRTLCMSNGKQLALANLIYCSDYDDRIVTSRAWMDKIKPYTRNEGINHCPSVGKSEYGYALNPGLGGHLTTKVKSPAEAEFIYDSKIMSRSAVAGPSTRPHPGRHLGDDMTAFLDGHVKMIAR